MPSLLETRLQDHAAAFLDGDPDATGEVYMLTHGILANRATNRGALTQDDAEDAASDAILYVQGRGRSKWRGDGLMGLLNRAVDYMVHQQLRRRNKELLACDQAEEVEEDFEFPEDLEGFEERRIQEGAPQHEYLTSVTTTTPEDIVLAENIRQKMERLGRDGCGDEAWDIYAAHILYDESQANIAERYGVSQQRISQVIQQVNTAIRTGLLGIG